MAESFKTCFVVNPRGANGAVGRRWPAIAARLPALLGDVRVSMTERPMHAAELARRAIEDGYQMVVAVGGDGTIHEVINGCMEGDRAVRPGVVLGVVPLGTGGDFRKTLGLADKPEEALERLAGKRAQPMDVGRVRLIGHDGKESARYFANIASFGSSGQIAKIANEQTKILGGKASFLIASFRGMIGYRDQKVRLSFDGGPEEERAITTVAVCNGRFFGGGMMVAPGAKIDDGILHVTIWSGLGLTDFVTKSSMIYDGTHINRSWSQERTCASLRAEPAEEAQVHIEIDGEAAGRLPATFDVLPGALQVKG